ncbi:4-carboxymuconolactone decarboxylase-like protein [Alternaria alternata]|nr:4-carboxymuconolactone decarboxylase-like protein [Alternaria alternata]
MRLPYVPDPPNFTSEEDKAVEQRVRQRRGEKGLIALDRTLLHAPPVADGWNSFLGFIRTKTSLQTAIRETAICRVAVLNKAWYEWESHSPILESATDVTQDQVRAVLESAAREPLDEILGPRLSAVLAYTDAMTLDVRVPDAVFEKLKEAGFSDKEVVEITATIAAYNCVSRFLVALDVGERNAQTGPKEGGKE